MFLTVLPPITNAYVIGKVNFEFLSNEHSQKNMLASTFLYMSSHFFLVKKLSDVQCFPWCLMLESNDCTYQCPFWISASLKVEWNVLHQNHVCLLNLKGSFAKTDCSAFTFLNFIFYAFVILFGQLQRIANKPMLGCFDISFLLNLHKSCFLLCTQGNIKLCLFIVIMEFICFCKWIYKYQV